MKVKTLLTLIFLILLVGAILLISSVDTSKSRRKIIKNFTKNKELFEEVITELNKEDNDVHIQKKGNVILIDVHEHMGEKINIIRVKGDELNKYTKTIELMKKLDIEQISKQDEYIDFLFKSALAGGKSIVYLKDIDNYICNGHKIREKEQITEDWYYIELPGL